jgi:transcriptional regulator with XRE-family HTH domain
MGEQHKKRTAQFFDSPLNKHLREDITSKDIANVAKSVAVTQDAVRQWRSGYTQPRIEIIVKLAKHLGVTTDYLLGNEEAPTHEKADICKQTGLDADSVSMILSLPDNLKPALNDILSNLAECMDTEKIKRRQEILDENMELKIDLKEVYRSKLNRAVNNLLDDLF